MRNLRKRFTAALCAVVMAAALLPGQVWAEEQAYGLHFESTALELDDSSVALYNADANDTGFIPERDPYFDHVTVARYGRTRLAQEQNGVELLDVYDALVTCTTVMNLPQDYVVLKKGVDKDTFALAAQAFRADYPELFWAIPAARYREDNESLYIAA